MPKQPKFPDRKGSHNSNAKLNNSQILVIRLAADKPDLPWGWKSKLARKMGVTPSAITRILRGDNWQKEK